MLALESPISPSHFPWQLQTPPFTTFRSQRTDFLRSSDQIFTEIGRAASPSASGSEFEFDCRLSDLEDLPYSPKFISSVSCNDCFPSPTVSVGQLMAADFASSETSITPRSTHLKNGQHEIPGVGWQISERRSLRLASFSLRVSHANEEEHAVVGNSPRIKKGDPTKGGTWALKHFLGWTMRKRDQESRAQQPGMRSCRTIPQRSMPRQERYKRAQSEKLGTKKTALPYRHGVFGCFGGYSVFADMPPPKLASP